MPGQQFWVAPPEMISGPPDDDGFACWMPVDSPLDEGMVSGFERYLQAGLPPLFKAYLTSKSLLGMDLFEGTLPDVDPRCPFEWLEWSASNSRWTLQGLPSSLVPFTRGPAGHGLLCFETAFPDPRGDCPIIYVLADRVSEKVFDSFAAYLDFLEDWLVYSSNEQRTEHFFDWLRRHEKRRPPARYYGDDGTSLPS